MNLHLTHEQQQIVESAEVFLSKVSSMSQVRAHTQSLALMDESLWSAMSDLGWCGLHLPEEVGGLDLDWVSVCLLQEQMGRRLACVPFFDSTVLSATALKLSLPHPRAAHCLAQIAQKKAVAAMAFNAQNAVASPTHNGWQLEGQWHAVGSAQLANVLVLPAHSPTGETLLFALEAHEAGLQIKPQQTLDMTRCMAQIQGQGLEVQSEHCLARGQAAENLLTQIKCLGAIGLAAEQVGVAQQCLDMALAYVLERQQFGRPIASFQAIKHRCAQMLVEIESARSAVYGSACLADTQPELSSLIVSAAQARVAATEASQFCARENLQLHGGVGFTWEYDPHFYLRRAQASSQRLGPVSEWLERVASHYDSAELTHL